MINAASFHGTDGHAVTPGFAMSVEVNTSNGKGRNEEQTMMSQSERMSHGSEKDAQL